MPCRSQSLPKSERMHSKKAIDRLFAGGGSKSMSAFPLRLVYKAQAPTAQMLISVPKRCLHRANKRNRVKRQVREAYRKNKGIIGSLHLEMAFIWLDSKVYPSDVVEQRVVSLMTRVREKVRTGEPAAHGNTE